MAATADPQLRPRAVRDHCLAPARAQPGVSRYGRMFPGLEPLRSGEAFIAEEGRRAVSGAASPFVDAGAAEEDPAAPAAGWPFFGQFVAHDLTADRSALSSRVEIDSLVNVRAPRLDLESVYGRGPADQPYLYTRSDPAKLLVGRDPAGRPADVPRNAEGVALVGDPRNDVHQPISQLHVAFLAAHNRLVDDLRARGAAEDRLFATAQRLLRWHYQWIVLEDYLPRLVGDVLAREARDAPATPFGDEPPFIPVEFADAAFRYGHSQIRDSYRLNGSMPARRLFPELMGFRPVPLEHAADWGLLFDLPGREPAPQRARRIDGRLVPSLIRLPAEITGELAAAEHQSLAVRDLQRGIATGLPSGESVARHLGVEPLTEAEAGVADLEWVGETPLWFYVLKEAEAREGGHRLGPVGGRIVAEVLAGVMGADPDAYRAEPGWRPELAGPDGRFGLGELLAFAAGDGP